MYHEYCSIYGLTFPSEIHVKNLLFFGVVIRCMEIDVVRSIDIFASNEYNCYNSITEEKLWAMLQKGKIIACIGCSSIFTMTSLVISKAFSTEQHRFTIKMLVTHESYHRVLLGKGSSIKESDFLAVKEHIENIRSQESRTNWRSADATVVWERKSNGYRIVDLRLDRFMQALRFVLEYYCRVEPVSKAAGLFNDALSIRAYMDIVLNQMKNMISLCALEEGTQEMVGVLIASTIMKKHQRRIQIKVRQGDTLREISMLKSYVVSQALFYETLDAEKIVSIDVLCVKSDHQRKGIGTALVRSCIARSTESACACVGIFTSGAAQTIAERLGFEILSEVPYKYLGWKEIRFQIFETCYPENYSMACMSLSIKPVEYSLPILPVPAFTEEPVKKRLKAKKRKLKNK